MFKKNAGISWIYFLQNLFLHKGKKFPALPVNFRLSLRLLPEFVNYMGPLTYVGHNGMKSFLFFIYNRLTHSGLGSRILDVEAFDTKQKPKVNHLVCASVWLLYFFIFKTKKTTSFFL